MGEIILALAPVAGILVLGQLLVRTKLFGPQTWLPIERLVYFVLFPCLIVRSLIMADFGGAPVLAMAATVILAQIVLGASAFLARAWGRVSDPSFGSIFQSNVRWNTYVALTVSAGLYGEAGLALTAVAAGAMIPVANLLSVWGFVAYGRVSEGDRKPSMLGSLVTNPLLMACVLGLTLREVPVEWPRILTDTLDILGRGTLALGLLAAGAGLDLERLRAAGGTVFVWSLVRLLTMPAIVAVAAPLIGVTGLAYAVAIIAASTPTAVNGYILAKQMGGDAQLAAALIAATTVLALATMPLVLALLLP